jgi:hypothetical protein
MAFLDPFFEYFIDGSRPPGGNADCGGYRNVDILFPMLIVMDLEEKVKKNNMTFSSISSSQQIDEHDDSGRQQEKRPEMTAHEFEHPRDFLERVRCRGQAEIHEQSRWNQNAPGIVIENVKNVETESECKDENGPVFLPRVIGNPVEIPEQEENPDLEEKNAPEEGPGTASAHSLDEQKNRGCDQEKRIDPVFVRQKPAELPQQQPQTEQDQHRARYIGRIFSTSVIHHVTSGWMNGLPRRFSAG